MTGRVVYLDYAATSAFRPAQVADAVSAYLSGVGATPGRGGHRLALEAGRVSLRCRRSLAELLDIPGDPGRIAFMHNATHALNTAMHGVLGAGDAVVVTQLDHNAVLRPAAALASRGVDVRLVAADADGRIDDASLDRALDGARLLCINGASNVLGTVTDVADLTARARAAGALTLLDAAQTAGHVPFSVRESGADMVALTGHKGLLGPQGTGALWARDGIPVEPLLVGGTGGDSMSRRMPDPWPDHLEAGTQNAPGIAGLLAGIEWLAEHGVASLHARLAALKVQLHDRLAAVPGVRVLSPAAPDGVPIVTVTSERLDPATFSARLDREHGVLVRPGLHCAPEAHRVLGTEHTGAVRFSLGWASTESDVDAAVAAAATLHAGVTAEA